MSAETIQHIAMHLETIDKDAAELELELPHFKRLAHLHVARDAIDRQATPLSLLVNKIKKQTVNIRLQLEKLDTKKSSPNLGKKSIFSKNVISPQRAQLAKQLAEVEKKRQICEQQLATLHATAEKCQQLLEAKSPDSKNIEQQYSQLIASLSMAHHTHLVCKQQNLTTKQKKEEEKFRKSVGKLDEKLIKVLGIGPQDTHMNTLFGRLNHSIAMAEKNSDPKNPSEDLVKFRESKDTTIELAASLNTSCNNLLTPPYRNMTDKRDRFINELRHIFETLPTNKTAKMLIGLPSRDETNLGTRFKTELKKFQTQTTDELLPIDEFSNLMGEIDDALQLLKEELAILEDENSTKRHDHAKEMLDSCLHEKLSALDNLPEEPPSSLASELPPKETAPPSLIRRRGSGFFEGPSADDGLHEVKKLPTAPTAYTGRRNSTEFFPPEITPRVVVTEKEKTSPYKNNDTSGLDHKHVPAQSYLSY